MIRKDKVETEYLPEMPLMMSIGIIRAMVVFPQSHHYPPQRGGTLVTAGRRPADIQSSTPSLSLIRLLKGSSMSPHRSSSRAMDLLRNHTAKLLQKTHDWAFFPIPESSVPWIRVKAECNAKICIVLSIAEAHPRIAVYRTAKRAFGFLPKAKACLRE